MSVELEEHETTWGHAVLQAIRGVRYGSVEVWVHDGRVVQIERREKVRLDGAGSRPDHRGRGSNHDRRADRTSGGFEAARAEEMAE
jgi:hypothetical protein